MEKSSWLRQSPHLHSTPSLSTQHSSAQCASVTTEAVAVWGCEDWRAAAQVRWQGWQTLNCPHQHSLCWAECSVDADWQDVDTVDTVDTAHIDTSRIVATLLVLHVGWVQAGCSVIAWGKRGGGYLLGFSDTTDCYWLLLCWGNVDDHSIWDAADSRLWTSSFMMIFHPTLSSEAQRQRWAQHHNLNNPCSHNFYIPFFTSSKTDSKAKLKCVTSA